MRKPKPFKVEFVDPDTMCVVEDIDSIGLVLEGEFLQAFYFYDDVTDYSKELEIRVKE